MRPYNLRASRLRSFNRRIAMRLYGLRSFRV